MIRNSRRTAALGLGGALVLSALSGCGAGFTPQTSLPTQPAAGVNAQIPPDTTKPSQVSIRNLFILGPGEGQKLAAGAAAPVYAVLIDNDGRPDKLVSVTSPAFSQGSQIAGGGLLLPPQQLVSLNNDAGSGTAEPQVLLKGLSQELLGGEYLQLTLGFDRAGSVTLQVPVVPRGGPYATYPPAPTPTPTPTPTATPAATATGPTARPSGTPKPGKKTPAASPSVSTTR